MSSPLLATSRALSTARILLGVTILYNVAEGVIAIASGIAAGSISLVAFGADSYLEVAGRLRRAMADQHRGSGARRGGGTTSDALHWLDVPCALGGNRLPGNAGVRLARWRGGIARWDRARGRIGDGHARAGIVETEGRSRWTPAGAAAEAKETIACSYLSLTLLAGLVANLLFGWWWLDAATALLLVPWLVREGLEGVRGDACFEGLTTCFCRACLYGVRQCRAVCCPQPAG